MGEVSFLFMSFGQEMAYTPTLIHSIGETNQTVTSVRGIENVVTGSVIIF